MRYPDTRPDDWVSYYIGLAFMIAAKSHDAETQHGCILTSLDNRILSVGYNGFPRGIDDSSLPNVRPDKYFFMSHAERNSLANLPQRVEQGIAYVTGHSCNDCLYALWQHNIKTVYMYDKQGWKKEKTGPESEWFNHFLALTSMTVHLVKPDLSWVGKVVNKLP